MIADNLLRRMWLFDGEDRRVEVWLRHDGKWFVCSLRKRDKKAGWVEVRSHETNSQAAVFATAQTWVREAEGEMP